MSAKTKKISVHYCSSGAAIWNSLHEHPLFQYDICLVASFMSSTAFVRDHYGHSSVVNVHDRQFSHMPHSPETPKRLIEEFSEQFNTWPMYTCQRATLEGFPTKMSDNNFKDTYSTCRPRHDCFCDDLILDAKVPAKRPKPWPWRADHAIGNHTADIFHYLHSGNFENEYKKAYGPERWEGQKTRGTYVYYELPGVWLVTHIPQPKERVAFQRHGMGDDHRWFPVSEMLNSDKFFQFRVPDGEKAKATSDNSVE